MLHFISFNLPYFILKPGSADSFPCPVDKQTVSNKLECSECNKVMTNNICVQCNVPYCTDCFRLVHLSGKALRKHKLTNMANQFDIKFGAENVFCKRHNSSHLDYYCLECKQTICQECKIDVHCGHSVSTLILEVR